MEDNNLNAYNSFGSNLEEYIKSEVQRQVEAALSNMNVEEEEEEAAVASDDNSATTVDLSSDLQELEDLLSEVRASTKEDTVDNQLDSLLTSLESFSSPNADSLESLASMIDKPTENASTQDTTEYYLDKLGELSDTVPENNSAPAEKSTGMAYAMDLLQQYKSKNSN